MEGALERITTLGHVATWVDRKVKYSQSQYCDVNGEHRSNKSFPGAYRTDCSGLVSMAWGLPVSYNTRDLFYNTFEGAEKMLNRDKKFDAKTQKRRSETSRPETSQLVAFEDLMPGDALYYPGHVMVVISTSPPRDVMIHHHVRPVAREDRLQRLDTCRGDAESGYTLRKGKGAGRKYWCLRRGGDVSASIASIMEDELSQDVERVASGLGTEVAACHAGGCGVSFV